MNEDKATRYHRLRRRAQAASVAASAAPLVLLLVGRVCGALRDIRQPCRRVASCRAGGARLPAASIVVALFLLALIGAITLPFTLYRDWVLDRRYGLERVSLPHLALDLSEERRLGVALAIGALIVMHASAWISADWWWLIAALSLGGAQIGVTMAVPSLLPLFARLRPLTRAALGARLDRLAKKAGGMTLPVYEWRDDDRRATCASGPRGSWAHAPRAAFGHAARSVWRGRDRSDRRARTRASRASRSMDGGAEPSRNADRGLLARASVAGGDECGQRQACGDRRIRWRCR